MASENFCVFFCPKHLGSKTYTCEYDKNDLNKIFVENIYRYFKQEM